jgi:hypothetical protein
MNRRLLARYVVRETMGLLVMAVALFWPAGTVHWWQAWAALAVIALWSASTAVVILRYHPDLLAERLGPRRGAQRWDVVILGLIGVTQLVRYLAAGFDHRYGWTGPVPLPLELGALAMCALGYAAVVWATAENAFFSQIVRLQPERGQVVVTTGPYRYMLARRTVLEDGFLRRELRGYDDYAETVRYRWVPRLW